MTYRRGRWKAPCVCANVVELPVAAKVLQGERVQQAQQVHQFTGKCIGGYRVGSVRAAVFECKQL